MKNEKTIKFYVALWLAKLSTKVLKLLKRNATSFPGDLAIKICPNFLGILEKPEIIIGVTGTNGKTTTTNMIYKILKKCNKKVICNKAGNNIGSGITTTLLKKCNVFGKIKAEYLLLETDEHWVPVIYSKDNLKIDTLIVLNFFRDQLDRAGEIETIVQKLEKFLVNYNGNLILNGNDPNVLRLGIANKHGKNYYYGIDKLKSSYKISNDKMEGIICPNCKEPLTYSFYQYSHIGSFKCLKCGYGDIDFYCKVNKISGNRFYINNEEYITNNPNLYHIYNLLAIITLKDIYSLDKNIVKNIIENYKDKNGRHQKFIIDNKECVLNLGKNPTGFNVVLRSIKNDTDKKELLIVLNDNINDGKDVSWIWDIDFKNMKSFDRIICTGTRAYDIAITIKCNGYKKDNIIVEHSLEKAIKILLKTQTKKYIISNYSPLINTKEILDKLEKGDHK